MDKKKMKILAAVMTAVMLLSTLLSLFAAALSSGEEDHEGHDHAAVQQVVDYI